MIRFLLAICLFPLFAHGAVDKSVAKKALTEFNKGTAVMLDVREDEEVAQGRVKGALVFPKSRLNTPEWDKFVASLKKDKPIYVYCRSGRRSEVVVGELKKLGFDAQNAGGLINLKKAGADTQ